MQAVDHPQHYQGASKECAAILRLTLRLTDEDLSMECIDFIESHHQYSGFHLGNAIKYLWRCGEKGDTVTDLQKALWYLKRWSGGGLYDWRFFFLRAFGFNRFDRVEFKVQIDNLILAVELKIQLRSK
jgi:hypothetical protein